MFWIEHGSERHNEICMDEVVLYEYLNSWLLESAQPTDIFMFSTMVKVCVL
jgi:hypothetical protein